MFRILIVRSSVVPILRVNTYTDIIKKVKSADHHDRSKGLGEMLNFKEIHAVILCELESKNVI